MKILHTSDIHLKEYEDERWKAFCELIELGKEHNIDIFIVSGDLFNKDFDADNLRPKIRGLFSNCGFKIVIIPGNHDSESFKSGFYFGEDAIIIDNLEVPYSCDEVNIWGLPFESIGGEKILEKLRSLNIANDKKNILLYHGELTDTFYSRKDFGEDENERYMPVKLSYFDDLNINYVLAGHFHKNFDVLTLKNGGYFVYPGSPISITKRETGQRKVNIFTLGEAPKEFPLNTPYYEEINIELDPFKHSEPLKIIKEELDGISANAKAILTVTGYINSDTIDQNETELMEGISKISEGKAVLNNIEFKDIKTIVEDDLFKSYIEKLEQRNHDEIKQKQLREVAIDAMRRAIL